MKKGKSKNRQSLLRILRNNAKMIAKVGKYSPLIIVFTVIEGISSGVLRSVEALFTVRLFNALDTHAEFASVAHIIGVMAVTYIVLYLFERFYWSYFQKMFAEKLRIGMHGELFKKASSLDLSCYDDPEFYNDFVWAMNESDTRALEIIEDLRNLISCVVASGTIITLLFTIDIKLAFFLIISSAVSIVLFQVGNKVSYNQDIAERGMWRKKNYINRVFQLPDYSKEVRITRVPELLLKEYDDNTNELLKSQRKFGMKYFLLYGFASTLFGEGSYYGSVIYMFLKLIAGEVLIGSFAASVNVVWRMRWLLSDFVERISKFPKHSLYIEKYLGFLSYKPEIKTGEKHISSFESLEVCDVSFSYDFASKPKFVYHDEKEKEKLEKLKAEQGAPEALRHISLSIKKGEKIAVVGYNGAGKTTLIKLLMRLYDPTSGVIKVNGTDIREYDITEYRKLIGTVFQDYKIFASSVAENVMYGDYKAERDTETVNKALSAAGFDEKLATLSEGIDTKLTREFDEKGTNLSGGEQQKVAIARIFAKPYGMIIMDEPSSALDPTAEYNLNRSILSYASDKTVIFISHRLSTTRIADRIYMFAGGELIEHGSHAELMERNGKYAEMFNLQAEKYRQV